MFRWPCVLAIPVLFIATGCKHDTSTSTEEEAAYLADYERPSTQWGFMDAAGQLTIEPRFDAVQSFSAGLAAVSQNGRWGYVDRHGQWILEPQFRAAWSFHGRRARVKPFDEFECFVSPEGQLYQSPDWSAFDDFSEGLAIIESGSTYGYVDTNGTVKIRPIFSSAKRFQNYVAIVQFQDRYGVILPDGEYLIPPEYNSIKQASDPTYILGHLHDDSYLFTVKGKQLDREENARMLDTDGINIAIRKDGQIWIYALKGKKLIHHQAFEQAFYLGHHVWACKTNDGYQVMDRHGEWLNAMTYEQLNKFSDGLAAYKREDLWGYLDTSGIEITEPAYGLAWDFGEGLARAAFRDGFAFINKNQQVPFYPPEGAIDMRDFKEGLAPIKFSR